MADERGLPNTIVVPTPKGAAPVPLDPILITAPFEVPPGRTPEDLARLKPEPVASVRDVCKVFKVRVEGVIKDEKGDDVTVSHAAEDENSFTLGGFVRSDPTMRRMYVKSRLADWLASLGLDSLSEAEVAELARRADFLEKSLETEQA